MESNHVMDEALQEKTYFTSTKDPPTTAEQLTTLTYDASRPSAVPGGGWYLLGVQSLTAICLMTWGVAITMALLWAIDKVLPIRMDPYEELLGADLCEHRIRRVQVGVSRALSALRPYHRSSSIEDVGGIGVNTGHNLIIDKIHEALKKKKGNNPETRANVFINQAFEETPQEAKTFTHRGFLNKRQPGRIDDELHATIDSVSEELSKQDGRNVNQNGGNVRTQDGGRKIEEDLKVMQSIKGKKLQELTVTELEEVEDMNANEDRFRNRFDDDFQLNATGNGLKWTD